jgi:hypothetical protein
MASIDFIVNELLRHPRAQFFIYARDDVVNINQREVVAYRSIGRGRVRRAVASQSRGVLVPAASLRQMVIDDVHMYRDLYFTFVSAPLAGLCAPHDGSPHIDNHHRVIFPTAIARLLRSH